MEFNPTLDEDQLQIKQWVHDFAADVIRPNAAEWDEREETPWPILEEAAKIGLYGWEFLLEVGKDPTGLTMPRPVTTTLLPINALTPSHRDRGDVQKEESRSIRL